MAVIGEFRTPSSEFLLERAMAAVPDLTVEIERMVSDGDEHVMPYFWLSDDATGTFEAVEAEFEDDPTVTEVELVERHGDHRLYRAHWRENLEGVLFVLEDVEATILEAVGADGEWSLRIMFPDQRALSAFHDYCADRELDFELERFYDAYAPTEYGKYGITSEQREALVAAYERGYFSVPRQCTMQEVAADVGVSQNAVSARLRRGHETLIEATLVHDESVGRLPKGDTT